VCARARARVRAGIVLQATSFNIGFTVVKIIIIIIVVIIIIIFHHHRRHHCIHIGLCALCKCSFLKALRFGER
jgi:sugar phosphate permease